MSPSRALLPGILTKLSGPIGRRYGLSAWQTEDMGQDVAVSILEASEANPELGERLADPEQLTRYARTCLRNAARTCLRKQRVRRCVHSFNDPEYSSAEERIDPGRISAEDFEDATWIVQRLRRDLGTRGRLALDVACGQGTIEQYAADRLISVKRARMHFMDGCQFVHRTAMRILAEEFGDQAGDAVLQAAAVVRRLVESSHL